MDLNRTTIIGRLTRDPEVRSIPSGKSVCTITVATGRVWTDQAGQKQKESEFHSVVLWGKLAEIAGQYMRKGARVYMEGRLRTREWTGQDGVKRYRTEIVAENMIMLDGPKSSGEAGITSREAAPVNSFSASEPVSEAGEEEIKVEDIPF
jgi:single-strand DNA-binding protein